jgi:hypothetical protein
MTVPTVSDHYPRVAKSPEILLGKKDGAESVNIEVYKRNISRPVVRRLGGTMNDPVKAVRLEEVKYLLPRANGQVQIGEAPGHFLEMTKPPGGITRGAKELLAHVLVYPEYDMARLSKYSTASEPISPRLAVNSIFTCNQL